ncbi:MAG: hypothetical protein ACYC1Q_10595 [Bacteroidia bacterium]
MQLNIIGWILGAILVGFAGTNRKGGFLRAFLISLILTPVIGLFLTISGGVKNPKGCIHCGNKENEAEYCGLCGKNEMDALKEPQGTA